MKILIFTNYGDTTTAIVAWGLRMRGHEVVILYPSKLTESDAWTYDHESESLLVKSEGSIHRICIFDLDVVWFRRVPEIYSFENKIEGIVDRANSESDVSRFVASVVSAVGSKVFNVNKVQSMRAADNKSLQLQFAKEVGLKTPATIISNDFEEIKKFYNRNSKGIVYKPFRFQTWPMQKGDKKDFVGNLTTEIKDIEMFADCDFLCSPAIYQEKIIKKAEIRATIMGRSSFAVIQSMEDGASAPDVDWRVHLGAYKFEAATLPEEISLACIKLLKKLDLVYGVFDIGVNENGEYIFFEVNPAGQFLYQENFTGYTFEILNPFIRFLESQDSEFLYIKGADDTGIDLREIPETLFDNYPELNSKHLMKAFEYINVTINKLH